jgi:hypothetical protein
MHAGTLTGVFAAIFSALVCCWAHVAYWTQGGNCAPPCKPYLFTVSIIAGLLFLAVNVGLMQANLRASSFVSAAKVIAKRTVISFSAGIAGSLVLVGLAVLPIVAVISALAYGWLVAAQLFRRRDG